MGFYAPHVLVGDAKRRGIQVLRVAINASQIRSVGRDDQILLGLTTVRGLGTWVAETIVAEREANGPYRSLGDLLRRTGLSRATAEHLISVGAMADLGLNRRELLWQLGLLIPAGQGARGKGRQLALPLPVSQDMVRLRDMAPWERMVADYEILHLLAELPPARAAPEASRQGHPHGC